MRIIEERWMVAVREIVTLRNQVLPCSIRTKQGEVACVLYGVGGNDLVRIARLTDGKCSRQPVRRSRVYVSTDIVDELEAVVERTHASMARARETFKHVKSENLIEWLASSVANMHE